MNIKIGILGAAGFTGKELLRIFRHHPQARVEYITSSEHSGKKLTQVFPELDCEKYERLDFNAHPDVKGDLPHLDVLFLAVPDGVAMHWGVELAQSKIRVIDISGAFRIKDIEEYENFYNIKHIGAKLTATAVYGIPEINREKIPSVKLLANPGCYATSAILPLYYIRDHLKNFSKNIILDAKSGTSGAGGRKEKDTLPFSEVYENMKAYKVKAHQHIPEIVQEIRPYHDIRLKMTPHLLPAFRGIFSTIYLTANTEINPGEIAFSLREAARHEPFIRFREIPEEISLGKVQNTNFIDISLDYDANSGILVLFSALDNLMKGAAGQAVQNMNLMFGLPETQSLI